MTTNNTGDQDTFSSSVELGSMITFRLMTNGNGMLSDAETCLPSRNSAVSSRTTLSQRSLWLRTTSTPLVDRPEQHTPGMRNSGAAITE